MTRLWRIGLLGLAATAYGCGGGRTVAFREHPVPNPEIRGEITQEKVETALRKKVERRLEFLNEHKDEFRGEVVRASVQGKNYFYRYYDVFAGTPDDITVTVTPNPRHAPQVMRYEAKVTYPRERYETLYANRPTAIKNTDQFVRDRGLQIEHYEFLGDQWHLQHGTFEVEDTALWKDGDWSPVSRRLRRVEPKRQESFLRRIEYFFQDLRNR